MAYVTIDGMRMYYEEHGTQAGLPLILLHGFNRSAADWETQFDAFSPDYRVLPLDLRGHGRTNNPAGASAMNHRQFARDVITLCRELGIERAAFCGESTGAMLQLTLALEAPNLAAACILAGGTYYYGEELRSWWGRHTPDTMIAEVGASVEAMQAIHTAMVPDHWRAVVQAFINLGTHAHGDDFPEPDELGAIKSPVLIVHGDSDPLFPVEVPTSLFRLLPNAELCLLPNTGHVPPEEQPDWFNSIALDFLARRLA